MGTSEAVSQSETPRSIEEWISKIRFCWENTPEFQASGRIDHLLIICDGNRRAAIQYGFKPYQGHQVGVEVVKEITRACWKWNVCQALTFWLWSTQNWERDEEQVGFIMKLGIGNFTDQRFLQELIAHEVRFTHLGRKDRLPPAMREGLKRWEGETAHFEKYRLNLGIDYGGWDETIRAIRKMFIAFQRGEFDLGVFEDPHRAIPAILGFLDTAGQPIPNLVIRTGCSGEELPHTSGIMPLQTMDSVYIFSPALFPNFTPEDLLNDFEKFFGYQKRFGR